MFATGDDAFTEFSYISFNTRDNCVKFKSLIFVISGVFRSMMTEIFNILGRLVPTSS